MKTNDKILLALIGGALVLWYLKYRKTKPSAIAATATENNNIFVGNSNLPDENLEQLGITVIDVDNDRFLSPKTTSEAYRLLTNSINLIRADGKIIIPETSFYDELDKNLMTAIFGNTTIYDSNTGILDKQFVYAMSSAIQRVYNKTIVNVNPFEVSETIQKGDKGTTVRMLQSTINCILHSNELNLSGCYDRDTTKFVIDIFKTSGVLVNQTTGEIDSIFVKNLYNIMVNINNL